MCIILDYSKLYDQRFKKEKICALEWGMEEGNIKAVRSHGDHIPFSSLLFIYTHTHTVTLSYINQPFKEKNTIIYFKRDSLPPQSKGSIYIYQT